MSNAALTWAWPIPIKGPKKIVLIALAEHADAEGACWPSIQRLVLYSGICERAVRSALVDLESAKIITVDRKNGRAGRAGNHYLLDINTAPDTFINKAPHADLPTVSPKTIRHLLPENKASPAENKAPHSENKAPHAPEPLEPSRTLKEPSLSGASAPTPKPAKRQSRIPADWKPDDKGISFANERSVDIRAEVPKFLDRHQAKGSDRKSVV